MIHNGSAVMVASMFVPARVSSVSCIYALDLDCCRWFSPVAQPLLLHQGPPAALVWRRILSLSGGAGQEAWRVRGKHEDGGCKPSASKDKPSKKGKEARPAPEPRGEQRLRVG